MLVVFQACEMTGCARLYSERRVPLVVGPLASSIIRPLSLRMLRVGICKVCADSRQLTPFRQMAAVHKIVHCWPPWPLCSPVASISLNAATFIAFQLSRRCESDVLVLTPTDYGYWFCRL